MFSGTGGGVILSKYRVSGHQELVLHMSQSTLPDMLGLRRFEKNKLKKKLIGGWIGGCREGSMN